MIIQARPGDDSATPLSSDNGKTSAASPAEESPAVGPDETGALYRAVYGTCYGLGYGVALPLLLLSRAIPLDNAFGYGLQDGARAARESSDRTRESLGHAAEAIKNKAGDAYANIAQRVQEKVEATQDALAARRYRRRQA